MFFSVGFKFSEPQRKELVRRGLSKSVVDELQSKLDELASINAVRPASRREIIEQADKIAEAFTVAERAVGETNDWAISHIQSRALAVRDSRVLKTNIPIHELHQALAAYRDAAKRTMNILKKNGPTRGPDPEYQMRVAMLVKAVLDSTGATLDDNEKGVLTATISVAFEALGIARGEPRQFAAKVLAASK
jgi:hypothetical protein